MHRHNMHSCMGSRQASVCIAATAWSNVAERVNVMCPVLPRPLLGVTWQEMVRSVLQGHPLTQDAATAGAFKTLKASLPTRQVLPWWLQSVHSAGSSCSGMPSTRPAAILMLHQACALSEVQRQADQVVTQSAAGPELRDAGRCQAAGHPGGAAAHRRRLRGAAQPRAALHAARGTICLEPLQQDQKRPESGSVEQSSIRHKPASSLALSL